MQEGDHIGRATGFFLFRNLMNKYNDIKNDEALRRRSKRFGRTSIILTTIAIILNTSMLLLFGVAAFGDLELVGIGHFTSLVANIIAGIIVPTVLAIYGFVFAVLQVRLNRKASGVVGISLATLTLFGVVISIIFFFI